MTEASENRLQPCPDCGSMASQNAPACPLCGAPLAAYRAKAAAGRAAGAAGSRLRTLARVLFKTWYGRVALLWLPLAAVLTASAISGAEPFHRPYAPYYLISPPKTVPFNPVREAWLHHSVSGRVIRFFEIPKNKGPWGDVSRQWWESNLGDQVHREFSTYLGRIESEAHGDQVATVLRKWTPTHTEFHAMGNPARRTIMFVAAAEALVFLLVGLWLIEIVRRKTEGPYPDAA